MFQNKGNINLEDRPYSAQDLLSLIQNRKINISQGKWESLYDVDPKYILVYTGDDGGEWKASIEADRFPPINDNVEDLMVKHGHRVLNRAGDIGEVDIEEDLKDCPYDIKRTERIEYKASSEAWFEIEEHTLVEELSLLTGTERSRIYLWLEEIEDFWDHEKNEYNINLYDDDDCDESED